MERQVNHIQVRTKRDAASECQVQRASAMSGMTVFKFRARREAVDWRRISAVNVDRIISGLDYQTLQEHLMGVTYCSLEHECCPYCQHPVDPVLLKLFRLAQLTIEYLLYSQDFLTQNLQVTEERLQSSDQEKERLLMQIEKHAVDAKGLKVELKHRKKVIASQQKTIINADMGGYYKCQCCDKAFLNDSFLQSHMQRCHAKEYDIRLMSEKQKVQAVKLQDEIDKLKDQLNLTRSQLETQQQAALKASQEQQSKEEDMLKRLERWKEEESERMSRQMREMFLKESNDLKVELLQYKTQVKHLSESEERSCKFRSQQEQLLVRSEERHRKDLSKLKQRLKKQEEKWVAQFQTSQDEHERERNKLQEDLLQLQSVIEEQEASRRRLEEEMSRKVQEQTALISSQREQISLLSVKPPIRAAEPVGDTEFGIGSTTKNRNLGCGSHPPSRTSGLLNMRDVTCTRRTLELAPELTEEEEDSPSVSDTTPEARGQPPKSALKKNPDLEGQLHLAVEQTLAQKLQSLGIREGVNRITKEEYRSAMAKLPPERDMMAKEGRLWDELSCTLKARERDAEGGLTPEQLNRAKRSSDGTSSQVMRIRSGPPSVPQHHLPRLSPQPPPQAALWTKSRTHRKCSTPRIVMSESSEEELEEERPSARQGPSWGQSTKNRGMARRNVTKAVAAESNSESWDGSFLEEIDPRQLQRNGEQNGAMGKASKGLYVEDLRQSPKRHQQDQSQRPEPANKEVVREAAQKFKRTKIVEEDDTDWGISSLEYDEPSAPKQDTMVALEKSHESNSSALNSPTGKGQDGGLCVKNLRQSPEREQQDWSQRRPPWEAALQPAIKKVVREVVQNHMRTKIVEEDDTDWGISSLEYDEPSAPKQDTMVALEKSHESNSSALNSPTGKGQDGGAQEGGTSCSQESSGSLQIIISDWIDRDYDF